MRYNDKRSLATLALLLVGGSAAAQDSEAPAAAMDVTVENYDRVLQETAGLEVYNELVQRQIEAQQTEIQNYQGALQDVPDLERQVPPLLIRMVQGLAEFVANDIPFLAEERAERVAELQLIVERSDVTDAEKLRRILEAWQIESEYGGAYTTYRDDLNIDGTDRQVDFLQVGRIGLIYQTTDEEAITGAWDIQNRSWVTLGSEYRNSVRQALQMAQNQIAPELVLLPIPAPE